MKCHLQTTNVDATYLQLEGTERFWLLTNDKGQGLNSIKILIAHYYYYIIL